MKLSDDAQRMVDLVRTVNQALETMGKDIDGVRHYTKEEVGEIVGEVVTRMIINQ
jgi:hypothetical protein